MRTKKFSFVIPAYNDAVGLQNHLDFFFAKSEHIQLVIVDDCSTDETKSLLKAAKPPKNIEIVFHSQEENAGPARARNTGLAMADGDFVMFLDADDILADCFFDYIVMSPLANGADFVMFKYHLAQEPDERYTYDMHRVDAAFFSKIDDSGFPMKTFTLEEMPSALTTVNFPWNKIYRGDFIRNADIRFPEIRMHEDIPPHWYSFLRANEFGILSWAPPLITHYEVGAGRATDYVGELRLGIFPVLVDLNKELQEHENSELFLPEFKSFCEETFTWMTDTLCAANTTTNRTWRNRYKKEITAFWDKTAPVQSMDLILEDQTQGK